MFLFTLPYIIQTLEVISHKLHLRKYPDWQEWDLESRRQASALLSKLNDLSLNQVIRIYLACYLQTILLIVITISFNVTHIDYYYVIIIDKRYNINKYCQDNPL